MPNLQPLITLNYWFSLSPQPFIRSVFIGLGILLIILWVEGAVTKWFAWKERKNPPLHRILSRWGRCALTLAAIGTLFFFFDYEQTPMVSARFWWLLLLVVAIVWKVYIIIDFRKRYPKEKAERDARLAKEKYMPKG